MLHDPCHDATRAINEDGRGFTKSGRGLQLGICARMGSDEFGKRWSQLMLALCNLFEQAHMELIFTFIMHYAPSHIIILIIIESMIHTDECIMF